jgi:probable addiction module antidote protein
MPKRTTDFREDLLRDLADPQEAAHYLNAALEDSEQMVLVALRDIAEARQMARVAEEAGVAREALYRMLCGTGNPTYSSLTGILSALGLRIMFVPEVSAGNSATAAVSPNAATPQYSPKAGKSHGAVRSNRKPKAGKRY